MLPANYFVIKLVWLYVHSHDPDYSYTYAVVA